MIEINVDFSEVLKAYTFSKKQVDDILTNVVKGVAMLYVAKLKENIAADLKTTKNRYLNALTVRSDAPRTASVLLDLSDPIVKGIENGMAPYDMKQFLLNGKKVRVNKQGERYVIIPFSFGAPNTEDFKEILPQEIYSRILSGENVTNPILSRAQINNSQGAKMFDEYKHKVSIYSNIKNNNGFTSFRTVSENSDSLAFISKGIKAFHFFDKTLSNFDVDGFSNKLFSDEIQKLGL